MIDYVVAEYTPGTTGPKFLVWTPDETGGVLGSGNTRREALEDAVKNAEAFIDHVQRQRHERTE